jgi:hypothetical protein
VREAPSRHELADAGGGQAEALRRLRRGVDAMLRYGPDSLLGGSGD